MNFSIAPISTIILVSSLCGCAVAQERPPFESSNELELVDGGQDGFNHPENRLALDTGENLWNALSLEPIEITPESTTKLTATADSRSSLTTKAVRWKSDNVHYENPVFGEPMLERYGIAESHWPELRTGPRFFLKSLAFPFIVLTGRDRTCVSPQEPSCAKTKLIR